MNTGASEILFNIGKGESHHPKAGFKRLARRLRQAHSVGVLDENINADSLGDAKLLVLAGTSSGFTAAECDALEAYLNRGGSVLVMLGDRHSETNINYLLENHSISGNNDKVVRMVYRKKYPIPSEVYVGDGIVNRGVKQAAEKLGLDVKGGANSNEKGMDDGVNFVYNNGCTLNVNPGAVCLLSSGHLTFPVNRPTGALWEATKESPDTKLKGRLVVLGSVDMFGDNYLEMEHNEVIQKIVFNWLLRVDDNLSIHQQDADYPDLHEYDQLPDMDSLAGRLRSCLQESDSVPRDFTKLFDDKLFKFDTNLIPDAFELYTKTRVPKAPLTLIQPSFEVPMPPLQAAVFPPQLREQPGPALDLYDLDDEFASERIRLAQLANKCTHQDLEYYINEATSIVTAGMGDEVPQRHGTAESQAKQALFFLMTKLANWKKLHDDNVPQWNAQQESGNGPFQVDAGGFQDDMGQGLGGMQPAMNNMQQPMNNMQQGDFRPGTAAALAAVAQMEGQQAPGQFGNGGDFRPDTAAALHAVQMQSGGHTGGDFRPDTAAAIQAVAQMHH